MPLISVIVPVYQAEKTLERLMESVLHQDSFSDFEVILVDDGSPDRSFALCQRYAQQDSRVRCFTQKNQGPSAARNKGISEARGEWLQFIDADDLIEKDMMKTLMSKVSEQPADTIAFGGFDDIYQGDSLVRSQPFGGVEAYYGTRKELAEHLHVLLNNNLLYSQCTKLYRRRIVEENQVCFREELSMGENVDFNIAYFSVIETMLVCRRPFYHYTHVMGVRSVSQSYYDYYFDNIKETLANIERFLSQSGADTAENRLCLANYFVGRVSSVFQAILNSDMPQAEKKEKLQDVYQDPWVSHIAKQAAPHNPLHRILSRIIRQKAFFLVPLLYRAVFAVKQIKNR